MKAIKKEKPKTGMLEYAVDNPIYGEDQLTQKNKEILLKAKKLRREGIYMFVRVRDGHVFVLENAEGRAYKIMDIAQLDGEQEGSGEEPVVAGDKNMMSQVDLESKKEPQNSIESGGETNKKSMGIKRTVDQRSRRYDDARTWETFHEEIQQQSPSKPRAPEI